MHTNTIPEGHHS